MNYLHSFRTATKLESHQKLCGNKKFEGFVIPSEDTKILEFHQYEKSEKVSAIMYADFESLIKEVGEGKNNPAKSTKVKNT